LGHRAGGEGAFLGEEDALGDAVRQRRSVRRALDRAAPADVGALESRLLAWLDDDAKFGAPIELVSGDLALAFDEVHELEALAATARPLAAADKTLRELLDAAASTLAVKPVPVDVVAAMIPALRDHLSRGPRSTQATYVDLAVKRALLEGRHLQRRTVLGERRVRCVLELKGASVPVYLPEAAATHLPMFERFRAAVAVEVRAPQDQFEAAPIALVALALGRRLARSR
jgi:hypothetical protein